MSIFNLGTLPSNGDSIVTEWGSLYGYYSGYSDEYWFNISTNSDLKIEAITGTEFYYGSNGYFTLFRDSNFDGVIDFGDYDSTDYIGIFSSPDYGEDFGWEIENYANLEPGQYALEVFFYDSVYEDEIFVYQLDISAEPNFTQNISLSSQTTSISTPVPIESTPVIDIYSDLNTPIYRFQSNSMPGTYLFVGEEERQNINQNFTDSFTEEGIGFYATDTPGDGLVAIYRFQSKAVPGTYLFAGEEEKQSINENFSKTFNYEGMAFYIHPMGAGEETTYTRFQNSLVTGTYLYATGSEADNIRLNYTNFIEEGGAFEARI